MEAHRTPPSARYALRSTRYGCPKVCSNNRLNLTRCAACSPSSCFPDPNVFACCQGAESASQCKCSQGYFDALAGGDGDSGPSCSACPYGGEGWDNLGATSITVCSCPVGRYLDEADEDCAECGPGTYKVC